MRHRNDVFDSGGCEEMEVSQNCGYLIEVPVIRAVVFWICVDSPRFGDLPCVEYVPGGAGGELGLGG